MAANYIFLCDFRELEFVAEKPARLRCNAFSWFVFFFFSFGENQNDGLLSVQFFSITLFAYRKIKLKEPFQTDIQKTKAFISFLLKETDPRKV